MNSGVAERSAAVKARLQAAAAAAGRDPAAVTLLAVSKRQPVSAVLEACAAGVTDFGENQAQELRTKQEAVAQAGFQPRWHFVGPLQRNKVNMVLRHAQVIHSVDRPALADAIADRVGPAGVDVYVQVNIGEEAQKSGVAPGQAVAFAREVARRPGLRLQGLMAIPPAQGEPADYFRALAKLSQELQQTPEGVEAGGLSMGMSSDFEAAVACGSTVVRVGTGLFGPRMPRG